jgi:hypothetical protein
MLRELIMLVVPNLADSFPLDILVANLVAAFLLGLVTALHRCQVVSDDVNMLLGAGIMGGMSTFSSFVYGSVVLLQCCCRPRRQVRSSRQSTSWSVWYSGTSQIIVGEKLGGHARRQRDAASENVP